MQKMRITIGKDGNFNVDYQEGFSGVSCAEKADIVAVALGGKVESNEKKDEYYQPDPAEDVNVLLGR